ncbi:MAG: branched-chain amino acid ABC transporter substrate-binding protein, partial [Anaerolineae bacterium]
VISGPNETLGVDSRRGIEIVIDDKPEVLGHPVELVGEDALCSAEGGQTALTKLASDPSLIGVIGTNCSSAGEPASKIASDAGMVLISPSNTAPSLTDPEGTWNPGYLRSCHNDKVQGAAMADFAYNTLGLRSAAVIHDGDPYTEGLASVFSDSFQELGGEVIAFEAVSPDATDVLPVLNTIAAAGPPEMIYYPVFIPLGSLITKQSQDVADLAGVVLAGADGMQSPQFIDAAGDNSEDMYLSGPDLGFANTLYDDFLAMYKDKYGTDPTAPFHAHAFDATNMLFDAIEKVAVTDDDGTIHIGRQALRDAVAATANMNGITGSLTCDAYGDCANAQISVSQVQGGEFVPIWP